jgi:tRNA-guanine family transglycosylase
VATFVTRQGGRNLRFRLITLHNLHLFELMNRARAEIEKGTFDHFRKTFVADYKTRDAMMIE